MLFQKTIAKFIYKHVPPVNEKSRLAENILYPKVVYPIYLQVQNNFRFCMQNRLLKRNEVLEFKSMLGSYVDKKEFSHIKFINDAHFIYTYLKSTNISKKQMLMLNKYLTKRLIEIPEPITVYGNLRVIK